MKSLEKKRTNKKHWKCINCGATITTDWDVTPTGHCPNSNVSHSWELQSETDYDGDQIKGR